NYPTKSSDTNVIGISLAKAKVLNSSCGKKKGSDACTGTAFGEKCTLALSFVRKAAPYSTQPLSFVYNLSDTTLSPNTSSKAINTMKPICDIEADTDVFKFEGNQCLYAGECQLDEDNTQSSVAIGRELSGIVFIVLIAYFKGRNRSHAGHKTILHLQLCSCTSTVVA
ncbi:Lysosome-associated membrane glycoprotein 1, partial [Galemys pyrenaicus]